MPLDLGVPALETERMRLRAHRLADFGQIREMWANPIVTKYIGGKPQTEEETWFKFLRVAGFWTHFGYGYWLIEDKASGAVVGEMGFGEFKRDITPSIKGEPEMGWSLAPAFHGKGYASEAAKAVIEWGDDNLSGKRMACIVDIRNVPSIRIAEKCGFIESCRTTYHGGETILFHRG